MVNPAETVAYKAADSATNHNESQPAILFRAVDVHTFVYVPIRLQQSGSQTTKEAIPCACGYMKKLVVVFDAPSMTYLSHL